MKKTILAITAMFSIIVAQAQINPVKWNFSAKKISEKVYEIHMTANMDKGWHLYSQTQPKDAIAIPTAFTFANNPLIKIDGKVVEMGKMEKYYDASVSVSANQYSNTVNFVQKITLKAAAKTNVGGTITYQTCDDKQCLPPKKVPFKVNIG